MGLDIYLGKCADLEAAIAAQEAFEAETDGVWADGVSKADREARLEAAAAAHGTDTDGTSLNKLDASAIDSTVDPTHMFKVGYFRSSYNGSGIERVLGNLGIASLHDIFQPADRYEFKPDWSAALTRVDEAIEQFEAHLATPAGKYAVSEVRPMFSHGVANEEAALKLFASALERAGTSGAFRSYSNADGEFYLDGMKVAAIITKKYEAPNAGDMIGRLIGGPAVFVVYEREGEAGKENWHLTALRIVRETIQYVLAQDDSQTYYLRWSG